jgi:hypothetical protein
MKGSNMNVPEHAILANPRRPFQKNENVEMIEGDRYALVTWSLFYGAMVEDSNNDLKKLLASIPEHIQDEELLVCEVFESKWLNEVGSQEPIWLIPLFEISAREGAKDIE